MQATAWALGMRPGLPDGGAATIRASSRLDDALRAFQAEQGSKRVPKEQVWRLVGGARRLRLTAQSLTGTPRPEHEADAARQVLVEESVRLAGLCDDLAARLSRTSATVAQELVSLPAPERLTSDDNEGYLLWVREHLLHVKRDLAAMAEPATNIAQQRAQPWWR